MVWAWDFHVDGLRFETPASESKGFAFWIEGRARRQVRVRSPVWCANYCIGAGVYLLRTQRVAVSPYKKGS